MIRVVLIGSGNLAYHLHKALLGAQDISLVGLVARRPEALADFEATLPKRKLGTTPDSADVFILAVADSAIAEVMSHYKGKDGLFVHTSGAMGLEVLEGAPRQGVLYPLQTFSRERAIEFQKVPLCIEAALESDDRAPDYPCARAQYRSPRNTNRETQGFAPCRSLRQ